MCLAKCAWCNVLSKVFNVQCVRCSEGSYKKQSDVVLCLICSVLHAVCKDCSMQCRGGGDVRKAMSCGARFILPALLMPTLRYQEKGGRVYKQIQIQTNTSSSKYKFKQIQHNTTLHFHKYNVRSVRAMNNRGKC